MSSPLIKGAVRSLYVDLLPSMPVSSAVQVHRIKELAASNNRLVAHITEMRTRIWMRQAAERAHPTLPTSAAQATAAPATTGTPPPRMDLAASAIFDLPTRSKTLPLEEVRVAGLDEGQQSRIRFECRHLIDAMRLNIEMIRLARSLEEGVTASDVSDNLRKLIANFEQVNRVLREMEFEVQRQVASIDKGLIARFAQ